MVDEGQRTTRPGINLEMIGIRLGDNLALVGRPEETCVVVALTLRESCTTTKSSH